MIRQPFTFAQLRRLHTNSPAETRGVARAAFIRCAQLVERAHEITHEAADAAIAREKAARRAAAMAADEAADKIRGANTRVVEITIHVDATHARAAVAEAIAQHRDKLDAAALALIGAVSALGSMFGFDEEQEAVRAAVAEIHARIGDGPGGTTMAGGVLAGLGAMRELLEGLK